MRKLFLAFFLMCMITGLVAAQDEPTPYEKALLAIEEARFIEAVSLSLRGLGLEELPPEIGQLETLGELFLDNNQLRNLPPELWTLTNLRYLYMDVNLLDSLPPEIGNLTNLKGLSVSHNNLTELPPEIGNLNNLEFLYINNNQLHELPLELGKLPPLVEFMVFPNPLTTPATVVAVQSNYAVLEYFQTEYSRQAGEKQRLIIYCCLRANCHSPLQIISFWRIWRFGGSNTFRKLRRKYLSPMEFKISQLY